MRNLNSTVQERIDKRFQTIDDNANPALYARLMRHTVPMGQKYFIERTIVKRIADITDSDVAVCHPRFLKDDEEIWVAYISGGDLHIRYTKNYEVLTDAIWHDYSLVTPAEACAIAFDSTVKKNAQGIAEFVTERVPWVFWIEDGALKAKLCTPLGGMIHELALENVTDVSAIRGPSGEYGVWDFGLTVFFVMGGSIYYRQLIDGEWYDAELITFEGLEGLDIVQIKAFNTWDYRVGLQILTTNGDLYEFMSFTEGLGTRNTEHLAYGIHENEISALLKGTETVSYKNADEHLSFTITPHAYNYSTDTEVPKEAYNIEDANGNWGSTIEIRMSEMCTGALNTSFSLEDSGGNTYTCLSVIYDERIIRLAFSNFNDATGDLTVTYTPGTLTTPVADVDGFSVTFTPENLGTYVPTVPEFNSANNNDEDRTIIVEFDKALTNPSENIASHLIVYCNRYDFYPDYPTAIPRRVNLAISSTEAVSGNDKAIQINLSDGMRGSIGDIGIIYDGYGGLAGSDGYVGAFDETFTPSGIEWYTNPNALEHLEFEIDTENIEAELTKITFSDYKSPAENLSFGISPSNIQAVLTDAGQI